MSFIKQKWVFWSIFIIVVMIFGKGIIHEEDNPIQADQLQMGAIQIPGEGQLDKNINQAIQKAESNFKSFVFNSKQRSNHLKYINRYSSIAIKEMRAYGVPASITMAQAILESEGGKSVLSQKTNNHFGIKGNKKYCLTKKCVKHEDDSKDDVFKVYPSVWESYRDHSLLLQTDRYKFLHNLPKEDYVGWAYGLKDAGYATDKNYPKKLIKIIEELELYYLDI